MEKTHDELKDLRQFGMTLAVILIAFGTVHFIRHHIYLSQWFFGIGLVILCIGLLTPKILKPAYAVFLKVAHAIGWFNTQVILIFIYFALVTPIAFVMKVFGKDLLYKKIDKESLTYWVKRPKPAAAREQLEKQF